MIQLEKNKIGNALGRLVGIRRHWIHLVFPIFDHPFPTAPNSKKKQIANVHRDFVLVFQSEVMSLFIFPDDGNKDNNIMAMKGVF